MSAPRYKSPSHSAGVREPACNKPCSTPTSGCPTTVTPSVGEAPPPSPPSPPSTRARQMAFAARSAAQASRWSPGWREARRKQPKSSAGRVTRAESAASCAAAGLPSGPLAVAAAHAPVMVRHTKRASSARACGCSWVSSSASSGANGSGEEAASRAALEGAPSTSRRRAAATTAAVFGSRWATCARSTPSTSAAAVRRVRLASGIARLRSSVAAMRTPSRSVREAAEERTAAQVAAI
eukprot:scaffold22261_cov62-Phaeocystis_antarctica.AAC.3